MNISSYSPSKAQDDINKLINNNEIQYNSGIIGCCKRNYLIFPNDDHKYNYNPNKLISDTLRKKVLNNVYITMPKSINKKTKVTTSSIQADLKHDYDKK